MSELKTEAGRALDVDAHVRVLHEWRHPNKALDRCDCRSFAAGALVAKGRPNQPTEALDVDSLTEALVAEHLAYIEQPESFTSHRDIATFVAREYAAILAAKADR